MINEEWIKTQIAEARKSNPNVTDSVVDYIEELLTKQLKRKRLDQKELKNISISILEKMNVHSTETGAKL